MTSRYAQRLGYDQAVKLYYSPHPPRYHSQASEVIPSRHYIGGGTTAMWYCSAYSMQQEVVSIQSSYQLCKCQKLPFQTLVESRAAAAAAILSLVRQVL